MLKDNLEMRTFVKSKLPPMYKKFQNEMTKEEILDSILDGTMFGLVQVDIQVPDSWDDVNFKPDTNLSPYEYFSEMSPLFCNTDVSIDSIGEYMQNYIDKNNLSTKPRRLLVGGMKASGLLLLSPLLKWYIEHGLLVTRIHQIVEYSKSHCFRKFCDSVTNDRRAGDINPDKAILSTLSKLRGNSAFGGTIINKEKHQDVKYVEGFVKSSLLVNNSRFSALTELGDDIFEVELMKKKIIMDNPIQIGFALLQYAKHYILSFYYDVLHRYIDRDDFELIQMDTDSLYFALSGKCLNDVIKPDMKHEFLHNIYSRCDDYPYLPLLGISNIWFPRECCDKHKQHDKRTPGLMKVEFQATDIVALSSKSYVAINTDTNKIKYSMKGVNNIFVDPYQHYKTVLDNRSNFKAENRGIVLCNNTMYSYHQEKLALSYFFCKRKVHNDGIHTSPLDICLH